MDWEGRVCSHCWRVCLGFDASSASLGEDVGVDMVTECVCGCDTKCMSPLVLFHMLLGPKNYANKWTERQKKWFHNNLRICNTQIKESRGKPEAHLSL